MLWGVEKNLRWPERRGRGCLTDWICNFVAKVEVLGGHGSARYRRWRAHHTTLALIAVQRWDRGFQSAKNARNLPEFGLIVGDLHAEHRKPEEYGRPNTRTTWES